MPIGSIATIDGSGQALPGTSAAVLDLGTVTDVDGILTETQAGRYRPDEAGYYVIKARGRFQLTHNNRLMIFWEVRKNGTLIQGSRHSAYGRNSSNDEFTPEAYAIEYFNGTTDYFEIFDERDTGDGTPAGTYQDTHAAVEYYGDLSDGVEYIRVSFGTQTSMPAATYSPVQLTSPSSVVATTDSSVLDISGNGIRLREADRPYLIVGGFGDTTGPGSRSGFIGHLQHNSAALLHSYADVYNRNGNNNKSHIAMMGLVRPGTADQSVTMHAQGVEPDGLGNPPWGSVDSNSYTFDTGGLMILALPASTEIGIYEGDNINQTWSGTAVLDLNYANDAAVEEDTASFSKQNGSTVRVEQAENTSFYAGGLFLRTAASGSRQNNAIRVEIDGVDIASTIKCTYCRGDQSADDHFNGCPRTWHTWKAAVDADVQLEKFQQGGQNNGANDSLRWMGGFFINLATLAAADKSGSGSETSNSSAAITGRKDASNSGDEDSNSSGVIAGIKKAVNPGVSGTSNSSGTASGFATEEASGSGDETSNSSGIATGSKSTSNSDAQTSNTSGTITGTGSRSGSGDETSNSSTTYEGSLQKSGSGSETSESSGVATGIAFEFHSGSGDETSESSGTNAATSNRTATVTGTSETSGIAATGIKNILGTGAETSNTSGSYTGENARSSSGSETSESSGTYEGGQIVSGSGSETSESSGTATGLCNRIGTGSENNWSTFTYAGTSTRNGVQSESSESNGTVTGLSGRDGSLSGTSESSGTISGFAVEEVSGTGDETSESSGLLVGTGDRYATLVGTSESWGVAQGPPLDGPAFAGGYWEPSRQYKKKRKKKKKKDKRRIEQI